MVVFGGTSGGGQSSYWHGYGDSSSGNLEKANLMPAKDDVGQARVTGGEIASQSMEELCGFFVKSEMPGLV